MLFGLVLATGGPTHSTFNPLADWIPQKNDRFIADTQSNIGYIGRENGSYTSFPIGSGKQKVISYMNKRYDAATPSAKWTVKSTTIQTNRIDFGKSGLFLRLYYNGTDRTAYGIHATDNIDTLLTEDNRYKSLGCILVSNQALQVLAQIYALNKNQLEVVTTYGLNETLLSNTESL